MEYSFPHYLLAKQSVDDRALNKDVLNELKVRLSSKPIRVIEIGAGIGTMLRRLIRWDMIHDAEYVIVDESKENIEYAQEWIPQFATESGLNVKRSGANQLALSDASRNIHVDFEHADVFDYIQKNPLKADLLIAHAVLDLLPLPDSLMKLFSLTNFLAWLTINFDGVTELEPIIDADLDEKIERLYHDSMNKRATGGDSQTGRHLFGHLSKAQIEILAAGASDWTVYPQQHEYHEDEAYFLNFVLHFFEESLSGNPGLNAAAFAEWLNERHAQIERGELIYIAHQMDFLCKVASDA